MTIIACDLYTILTVKLNKPLDDQSNWSGLISLVYIELFWRSEFDPRQDHEIIPLYYSFLLHIESV